MKLQAVNNVIIIKKDFSPALATASKEDIACMKQIPEPYSGHIDSMGFEPNENLDYSIGDYVAFCDMGGAYIQIENDEYVVVTPDMIIGKLEENE